MKLWGVWVICTILCWGAYVPTLHHGQMAFGDKNSALRAFLFVGLAYLIVAALTLFYLVATKAEPLAFTTKGVTISTTAGILGAVGAIGIVFAMRAGGKPLFVAPLVFAGAPIVNTIVSMAWSRPATPPKMWFYVGILMAGAGAALALRFKPT
ncbi:MAG: hypothetical protein ACE5E5_05005 [Phycisphaerae bacterium]